MADETTVFACPRCGNEVTERFWGPCQTCRSELVSLLRSEAVESEAARFEPAMHVVPNHVATKD
jgi:predicted ATP-dependent serine protease